MPKLFQSARKKKEKASNATIKSATTSRQKAQMQKNNNKKINKNRTAGAQYNTKHNRFKKRTKAQ